MATTLTEKNETVTKRLQKPIREDEHRRGVLAATKDFYIQNRPGRQRVKRQAKDKQNEETGFLWPKTKKTN